MSETILKCENLCKHFGKKQILDRVSLEVKQGDILGFIGPNGAGKTTTIKLILGLQSIDSGTVKINGYDIQKDFEKAIEKVGTIVENPDLYMYLSGYDNLKLIANLYKNVDKKRIDEVVKLDVAYMDGWTIWRDIKILLKTIKVVVMKDGAK